MKRAAPRTVTGTMGNLIIAYGAIGDPAYQIGDQWSPIAGPSSAALRWRRLGRDGAGLSVAPTKPPPTGRHGGSVGVEGLEDGSDGGGAGMRGV